MTEGSCLGIAIQSIPEPSQLRLKRLQICQKGESSPTSGLLHQPAS